jgi:hypothetical protein
MKLYDQVKSYLEREPRARERRNKDNGLVNVLIERYPALENIDKKILIDFVKDYDSANRYWRLILKEREDLRGKDYKDKEYLSQDFQSNLGYESGYNQLKYERRQRTTIKERTI